LEEQSKDPKNRKDGKKTEATLLANGEPWRFQDGSPYPASDLTELISVGTKRADTWLAASACRAETVAPVAPVAAPARLQSAATLPGHHVFLAMSEQP